MQKSAELNLKLNSKDACGHTAFHWACINGLRKIAEKLMQKSAELNIELNVKAVCDNTFTAFYYAFRDHPKIAEKLMQQSAKLNIDLK